MSVLESLNLDINSLNNSSELISAPLIDSLKIFSSQEHRLEALRTVVYGKLHPLSKQIIQDTEEWRKMDLESKCRVIGEIQECLYDLQLIEQASQQPLFPLARAIFSSNKRRCAVKVPAVKLKPSKKQKLDLRRSERDINSPSVASKHTDDASSSQSHSNNGEATTRRRGYHRERTSQRSRPDSNAANHDDVRAEASNSHATPSDDAIGLSLEATNRTSSPALDNALPRRRSALAAAVSVSETVNPQRSSSPRKQTTAASASSSHHGAIAASSTVDDDDASDDDVGGGGASTAQADEETYCICEQISFGDMICCDYSKCPIEWFHFSCVNIKIKPKGKKWFCPLCRGDKPTVLRTTLQRRA